MTCIYGVTLRSIQGVLAKTMYRQLRTRNTWKGLKLTSAAQFAVLFACPRLWNSRFHEIEKAATRK